ncbi:MAG: tetratricopeptide repeat protein [Moraxellaceae bacterium]|nr:tetratricopeptide repeat protein [Moraxellaceae bacterium]
MLNKQKLITSLLVTSLTLTTGLTTSLTHADSQLSTIVQKDYQKKFNKYLMKKEFDKLAKLLQKWEQKDPTNEKLYINYFNYYVAKSMDGNVTISKEKPQNSDMSNVMVALDKNRQPVMFMTVRYNQALLNKALAKIDEGIARYPNRLDMRFGKAYILSRNKDWNGYTNEMVKAIQQAKVNNNQWLWEGNKAIPDGKSYLLASIQGSQVQLFNAEDKKLLANVRKISNELLKVYPNNVQSINNIATSYAMGGDFDNGLKYFLQAEKINPQDPVILLNIANVYKKTNNKAKAKEYYQRIAKLADPRAKKIATEQLEKLK